MGGLRINFAEVEGSFEPLPEGRYDCIISRIEVRESNSSEHDYLNWEFEVQDEEYEGRKLWLITSLSPRARFRLKDTFLELGVIEEDEELDLEWADDVDITPKEGPLLTNPSLDGMACIAVVTNEMYEGKERNRVGDVLAADGGSRKSASKKSSASKKATGKKEGKAGKRRRALR